jgi:beta-xylosidase
MKHEPDAKNCWAPKIFYLNDEQKWMIVWSTWIDNDSLPPPEEPNTLKNHRIYYTTTKDFVNFNKPEKLFDPGHSCIDAYLLKDGRKYILFYKDEREHAGRVLNPEHQNIHYSTGSSPYGPFTDISGAVTSQNGSNWFNEGPSAIKSGKEYFVFYDHHSNIPVPEYFGAVKSTDLKNWTDVSDQMSFPDGFKHGTVIKVDGTLVRNLLER